MLASRALGAVEPAAAAAPVGSRQAQGLLPGLEFGQLVRATVEAQMADGSFHVTVANQPLRMALPGQFSAGEQIELKFLAREPRPTFMLVSSALATDPVELSLPSRLLAAIMPAQGGATMAAPLLAAAPLSAALSGDAAGMSTALLDALTQSGLFYESHQAQWVAGKRPLAQLLLEPQARLAAQPLDRPAGPGASGAAGALANPSGDLALPGQEPMLSPRHLGLLQHQLGTLESGRIMLQLEVWPRQWMDWAIEPEPGAPQSGQAHADAPADNSWSTRMQLELPRLGRLDALLRLDRDGLRIDLETRDAASAQRLRAAGPALLGALQQAGLQTIGLTVATEHHEPA
jgi:hypothetical protein